MKFVHTACTKVVTLEHKDNHQDLQLCMGTSFVFLDDQKPLLFKLLAMPHL